MYLKFSSIEKRDHSLLFIYLFFRKDTMSFEYPQKLIEQYLEWTLADTLLYHHFNHTCWERINVMGRDDFMAEVDDYEKVLEKTIVFCHSMKKQRYNSPEVRRKRSIRMCRWRRKNRSSSRKIRRKSWSFMSSRWGGVGRIMK